MSFAILRRRWFRFSLRALLIFVTAASALVAWNAKAVRDSDKALIAINQTGLFASRFGLKAKYWARILISDRGTQSLVTNPIALAVDDALLQELERDLRALGRIELLALDHSPITNESLPVVGSLDLRNGLDLSGTAIDDAGLVHLEQLRNLRTLNLSGTKTTPAGIARLQRVLPQLTITSGVIVWQPGRTLGASPQDPIFQTEVHDSEAELELPSIPEQ